MPPDVPKGIAWRTFGGLRVGLVSRRTMIALKLFAAADKGPRSVHCRDLIELSPTAAEQEVARSWVLGQDLAPEWPSILDEVIHHVRTRR